MDKIQITGGIPLYGEIDISGAKNAALPLMAASLLTEEPLTLSNIPHLSDITTMASLLVLLGVQFNVDGHTGRTNSASHGRSLTLKASGAIKCCAPYDIVRKMRASIVVMGPLLARFGHAEISLPGGCAIGDRPIDLHLMVFEKMGATIELDDGYVRAKGHLKGADITFDIVSVGATENALMAATLADGITILRNAACEPEIGDLIDCLTRMGAKIEGKNSTTLTITGVEKLHSASHHVLPDRIEAGTYAVAAAITGGKLTLNHITADLLESTLDVLEKAGTLIQRHPHSITITAGKAITPLHAKTKPYPGFPTDMQAQIVALLCLAEGESIIEEHIFENRFMHVPELQRMGADIRINGHSLHIQGISQFYGAPVMATDLRASVCMVLAALSTPKTTCIRRVYHIDRGYERIEEKLSSVGATITRLKDI